MKLSDPAGNILGQPFIFIPPVRMVRQMRPSYLGKILLRWCDVCHTPVLADECSCGAATRPVPVTPPGDARPAFPADIALINRIYEDHFGTPLIPKGHLALLNKVPDSDRMEEIVVGGGIAGIIRYFPADRRWEPVPRPEACSLVTPTKRFVVIGDDAVPFIRDQGMSVLRPGMLSIDENVRAGDEVFILTREGSCIGVGRAKADAAAARALEQGSIVRTRRNIASQVVPGTATWEDAVRANADVLEHAEGSAVLFVQEVADRNPRLARNVSYSGGKDSLATLLVVQKEVGTVPLGVVAVDPGEERLQQRGADHEEAGVVPVVLVVSTWVSEAHDEPHRQGPCFVPAGTSILLTGNFIVVSPPPAHPM